MIEWINEWVSYMLDCYQAFKSKSTWWKNLPFSSALSFSPLTLVLISSSQLIWCNFTCAKWKLSSLQSVCVCVFYEQTVHLYYNVESYLHLTLLKASECLNPTLAIIVREWKYVIFTWCSKGSKHIYMSPKLDAL